jgi:choline dehydrogenase
VSGTAEVFDFIVTGSGSAGCPVAARLSEDGKFRVLLLEAGPSDNHPWFHIPLGHAKTFTHPRYNWMFESEPEKELNGRTLYQPRGKVLGGSSAINGTVYMRGTAADYDHWRQRGCEGWDWESVLPFFRRAEHQERGADEFHAVGGPLRVSDQARCRLGDAMIQAAIEAGIPANPDFNGAKQEGVGYYQTTTSNGARWSAAKAYLRPARRRANLAIATDAHATRILIEDGRAAGIEYRTPKGLFTARCRREIIVSGGVYGSPQLLQLSGLGPGALLQEFGIPVVRDVPGVGAHLHDHFNTYMAWRCTEKITVNDVASSVICQLKSGIDYVLTRSGHLANAGIYAGVMVKTDPRLEQPDMQINMWGGSAYERLRTGVKPHPFSAFAFCPVHLRPNGRGTVKIKSPDPLAPPAIQFNFLGSGYDFRALIYGMRLARKIAAQPALKPFTGEEVLPGKACQTDAQFVEDIRARGVSNLHPVGTCRMGREADAVVDPRLRVYGIQGLRVADASIMPQVPGGNTNAPSIMIGEKCAQMILEDARAA